MRSPLFGESAWHVCETAGGICGTTWVFCEKLGVVVGGVGFLLRRSPPRISYLASILVLCSWLFNGILLC